MILRFTFGTWSTVAWMLYWGTLYVALVCYEKSWFRPYSSVVFAFCSCMIALSIPYHLQEQIIFLSTGSQVSVLYIPKGCNHATLVLREEIRSQSLRGMPFVNNLFLKLLRIIF